MDKHTDRIQSLLNEDLDAMVLDGKKAKHKRRLIAVASVAAISNIYNRGSAGELVYDAKLQI